MYTFLHLSVLFKIWKIDTFDQYFGSKSQTLAQQNSPKKFLQLVLHILCKLGAMTSYLGTKLKYLVSFIVFCYNLRT